MTEKEIDKFIKYHPSMSFYRNHMQDIEPDEVRDKIITSIGTPGNLNIWDGADDALLDYIGMNKFIKKDSMGYKLSYDNHDQMAYYISKHIAHNICLMDNTYCNPIYSMADKLLEYRSIYFMGISWENCWQFLNYDISREIKEQLFYWCRWLNYTGCNNSKWYKDISKEFDNKRVATILEKNTGVSKSQIIKFLIMEDCYVGKEIHKEAMLKNEINVLFNEALFFIDVTTPLVGIERF